MVTTSNFAKSARHPDAVAISQGVPRFYRGKRYMPLAPPRWLLKAKDPELFDREYRKQLATLDPRQVAEELGPDAILLCWESFNVRCHRRLVAESIAFSMQPSKWDRKPTKAQLPMLF